ncbi:MAG TPA: SDR family NAD(P)-dependent oxidoreductase [Longimicrobiales bacterium]|nr:SDR family NAD(P)-dependent oxidoreductase [Longimicrobiales bacterium]
MPHVEGSTRVGASPVASPARTVAGRVACLFALLTAVSAQPDSLQAQVPAADVAGREIIMVTGSTGGLGRAVALQLAGPGTHIIVHGRNIERGQEVVEEAKARGSTARFVQADLGSLAQVRGLVRTILRDYDRIDLLVNNAGIGRGQPNAPREVSADGHELRFQVNYLSHFYLTRELLPLLRAGAPSRVVSVSSGAQRGGRIDFDDVMLERPPYQGSRAYSQSKLAQVFMTLDLAEELAGTGVTANAVDPGGYLDTDMVAERCVVPGDGCVPTLSPEEGAESVVNAARSPEAGVYFSTGEVGEANAQALDREARRRLRELSLRLVGLD